MESSNNRETIIRKWMDAYGTSILRMCIVSLHHVSLAEAATQYTFFKAYKLLNTAKQKITINEKAMIMKIAIHACRHYRRIGWFCCMKRKIALARSGPRISTLSAFKKELLASIIALPARYKETFLLYYYQGMTIEDVGFNLHLSSTAVQYLRKRATEKLRMKLERRYLNE